MHIFQILTHYMTFKKHNVQYHHWPSLIAQLVKNLPAVQETPVPSGSGRSPGAGIGYPLQYSGLENSTDCTWSGTRLNQSHFTFHLLRDYFLPSYPHCCLPGWWFYFIFFFQTDDFSIISVAAQKLFPDVYFLLWTLLGGSLFDYVIPRVSCLLHIVILNSINHLLACNPGLSNPFDFAHSVP